jgi:hypothetical protein
VLKEGDMRVNRWAVLVVASALSAPAVAAGTSYPRDVRGRIETAAVALAPLGFKLDHVFSGALREGRDGWAAVRLLPGREYRIVGRCDDGCEGLDLFLVREEKAIEQDVSHDTMPYLEYQAPRLGYYRVTARMAECAKGRCRFAVAVFSR